MDITEVIDSRIKARRIFETSDGQIHASLDAAREWQEGLEFRVWARQQLGPMFFDHMPVECALDAVIAEILGHWTVMPK